MAAAPSLKAADKRSTAMADSSGVIDTKIAPLEDAMAPTPPAQPNDSVSGSRLPSGLTLAGDFAQHQEQEVDSIAQALAGAKISTPTLPDSTFPSPPLAPSPAAQRVQETLAARSQAELAEAQRTHHLYIGNLSPKVSEEHLRDLFREHGTVVAVKILIHHHPQYPTGPGLFPTPYGPGGLVAPQMVPGASNYGFVEMKKQAEADAAVEGLNGKVLFDMPLKVSWAKQQRAPSNAHTANFVAASDPGGADSALAEDLDAVGAKLPSSSPNGLHHVFVGDLSAEVNDAVLRAHFARRLRSLHEARVMWDMHSGKSRGYGFLAFRDRKDAEEAISTMNGDWLGGRAIRINWANQKGPGASSSSAPPASSPAISATNASANSIAAAGAGQGTAAKPTIGWGSAMRQNNRSQSVQQQVAMQVGLARGPMNSYNKPVYAFGQQPPATTGPPRPAQIAANAPGTGSTGGGSSGNRKASFTSQSSHLQQQAGASPALSSASPYMPDASGRPLTYEEVLAQTPAYNTTVYVGNLPAQTTEDEVSQLFANLGFVIEVRMQSDRGYGFVKLDTHENAAQAIVQLNGKDFSGRPIRASWGKDRADSISSQVLRSQRGSFSANSAPMAAPGGLPVHGAGFGMMYGVMPHFGFAGGFFPGLMPMAHPGGMGPVPSMAAAAQMQQHMAAMQAQAQAQAQAEAQHRAAAAQGHAGDGQVHSPSPLQGEALMPTSNSAQDLSFDPSSHFYPGPYPYAGSYDPGNDPRQLRQQQQQQQQQQQAPHSQQEQE